MENSNSFSIFYVEAFYFVLVTLWNTETKKKLLLKK